jgi:murein DD-endopeptidase MepM/ murein hydrolase activator NlpD
MKIRKACLTILLSALVPAGLAEGYALRTVAAGDTVGTIAQRYGISSEALLSFNGLESALIHPGDVLRVPYITATGGVSEPAPKPPPGFREHVLQPGEVLSTIASQYGITLAALVGANPDLSSLDLLPTGVELLIPPREGLIVTLEDSAELADLLAEYGADPLEVALANEIRGIGDLQAGMLLFLPGVRPEAALERLARVREEENRYIWPLHGRITSYFGRRNLGMGTSSFHRGVDVAAPTGTPIVAARSGTVVFAGWSTSGYGYLVRIRHQGGDETWYGHHSKILVSVGEYVRQGETIGLVGSTGISTGPHLHFELHEAGSAIDPLGHLR